MVQKVTVTFITTVLNEEKSIYALLESLLGQSRRPDAVVIGDGGSTDSTVDIIKKFVPKFTKKGIKFTLFQKKGNRSAGRNEAIRRANSKIIVASDAGCSLDAHWLEIIVSPFENNSRIDVVAGYYRSQTSPQAIFEKCLAAYTCVMPDKIRDDFLPSSRSIAFKKAAWKQVGGYPEELNTCEDLMFARKLKENGKVFTVQKKAIVYWSQEKNLWRAFKQFFHYAQGDGQARYIRSQTPWLFARYFFGLCLLLLYLATTNALLLQFLLLLLISYFVWAIQKNYRYVHHWKALLYLPLLQLVADIAVLVGMSWGLISGLGFNSKRVMKNTFFLSVAEVVIKATGFLWVVFLARELSVSQYGRYSLVNSFIVLFAAFPDLGVGLIAIREIAKEKKRTVPFLSNALTIHLVLSVLTLIMLVIVGRILGYSDEIRILMLIAGLSLLMSSLRITAVIYFEAHEKMRQTAWLNSFNSVAMTVGGLAGYLRLHSLLGIFSGMLVGITVSVVVSWIALLKNVTFSWQPNIKIIKKLFFSGLPLGLASLSYMLYTRIDSIMLQKFLGEQAVGQYNVATPFIFALIQLLNVPFVIAVYPALTRSFRQDKARFKRGIRKSLAYVVSWSVPVALGVALLAPRLIPAIFGPKYLESIPILQIIIFFVPFASLSAILYKILIILDKQQWYLGISIVGVVINILANVYLIPRWGISGAAWAAVLTQAALLAIYISVVYYQVSKIKSS